MDSIQPGKEKEEIQKMKDSRTAGKIAMAFIVMLSIAGLLAVVNNSLVMPTGLVTSLGQFRITYVQVNVTSPVNGSVVSNATPQILFDAANSWPVVYPGVVNDSIINLSRLVLVFNGTDNYTTSSDPAINCSEAGTLGVNLSCSLTLNQTPDSSGAMYNAKIYAFDNKDNPGEGSIWFGVDLAGPSVTGYDPNGTSVNVWQSVIIYFSEAMDTSSLTSENILLADSSGTQLAYTPYYDSTANATTLDPYYHFGYNSTYFVNVSGVRGSDGNLMDESLAWNFTTGDADTDGDKIPDSQESAPANDTDGDGLNNSIDTLNGNLANINSDLLNLSITVNNSYNLAQPFQGLLAVRVYNGTNLVVAFDWNFSESALDFNEMMVNINERSPAGSVTMNGPIMQGSRRKTYYIDNLAGRGGVCIFDSYVASITQMSTICDGSGYIWVGCDGSEGSYSCTRNGSEWIVSGLRYSGVEQQDEYIAPEAVSYPSGPSPGTGAPSCPTMLECEEWSVCGEEGTQHRDCYVIDCKKEIVRAYKETQQCIYYVPPSEPQTFIIEGYPDYLIETVSADKEEGESVISIRPLFSLKIRLGEMQKIDLNADGVLDLGITLTDVINETHIAIVQNKLRAFVYEEPRFVIEIKEPVFMPVIRRITWMPTLAVVIILILVTMLRLSEIIVPNLKPMVEAFEKRYVLVKMLIKQGKLDKALKVYSDLRLIYEDLLTLQVSRRRREICYHEVRGVYYTIFSRLMERVRDNIARERLAPAGRDYRRLRLMYSDVLRNALPAWKKYSLYNNIRRLYHELEFAKSAGQLHRFTDSGKLARAESEYADLQGYYQHLIALCIGIEERHVLYGRIKAMYAEITFHRMMIEFHKSMAAGRSGKAQDKYSSLMEQYSVLVRSDIKDEKKRWFYIRLQKAYASMFRATVEGIIHAISRNNEDKMRDLYADLRALHESLEQSRVPDKEKKEFAARIDRAYLSLFCRLLSHIDKQAGKGRHVLMLCRFYDILADIYKDVARSDIMPGKKEEMYRELKSLYMIIFNSIAIKAVKSAEEHDFGQAMGYCREIDRMRSESMEEQGIDREWMRHAVMESYTAIFNKMAEKAYLDISAGRLKDAGGIYLMMMDIYSDIAESGESVGKKGMYLRISDVYSGMLGRIIENAGNRLGKGDIKAAGETYNELKGIYSEIEHSRIPAHEKERCYSRLMRVYSGIFSMMLDEAEKEIARGNTESARELYVKLRMLYDDFLKVHAPPAKQRESYFRIKSLYRLLAG